MRRIEDHVGLDRIRDLLVCDPLAGTLTWRQRPITNWRIKGWNKRFAGKVAANLNSTGHLQVAFNIDGVKYWAMAHRLIWAMTFGEWIPTHLEIDHRNRNPVDNRIANLRVCCRVENSRNKKIYANNTSGFKGVAWYPKYEKWVAQISVNGRNRNLGYFSEIHMAVRAYDQAAARFFAEFANSNSDMGLAV